MNPAPPVTSILSMQVAELARLAEDRMDQGFIGPCTTAPLSASARGGWARLASSGREASREVFGPCGNISANIDIRHAGGKETGVDNDSAAR